MYLDTVSIKVLGSDIEYPLQSNALSAKSILGGRVALTITFKGLCDGELKALLRHTRHNQCLDTVRATLPPSTLFADRVLLCRGYSISEPNALVETVSKYKDLH